jgi:hypothetical protein
MPQKIAAVLSSNIVSKVLDYQTEIFSLNNMIKLGVIPAIVFAKLAWSVRKARTVGFPFLAHYAALLLLPIYKSQ